MKKILLLISLSAFTFADVSVYTCGATVDQNQNEVTFDICANSPVDDIGGFQFSYSFDGNPFTFTSAEAGSGSSAAGFTVSAGGSTVLGFSFTGGSIPAGSEVVLARITGTFSSGSNSVMVGPDSEVISSTGAVALNSYSETTEFNGSATLDANLPATYSLKEAYPNPFNPTTTIEYNVETAGNVSIIVYDLMGREIKELVNEFKSPLSNGGVYSSIWDGTSNSGSSVSSGMYIYRMISNDFSKTHRLTLMK
jgi:hypothetical protein